MKLSINYCDDSQSKQFSFKNGKICSRSSARYEHLTFSSDYLKVGYKSFRYQYAKVEKVDKVGNYAMEKDSYGKWGEELCGIGEMNRVVTYRILNIKTKQCVLVNNSVGNLIDLGECTISNHNLWHITNVDEYNNKNVTFV
ncbi:hypothetical protein U3516DRAFT_780094 [Neocallimastix sp. 'constans']